MASMTNYLENEILDHILGTGAWTMPSAVYLGLFTAAPSDAGGGTEVSGSGYAREEVSFGAATGGAASNDGEVSFTASGGAWGTITHWAIFDAVSSGNMLLHGALAASKTIGDGDTLSFPIGNIDVAAD